MLALPNTPSFNVITIRSPWVVMVPIDRPGSCRPWLNVTLPRERTPETQRTNTISHALFEKNHVLRFMSFPYLRWALIIEAKGSPLRDYLPSDAQRLLFQRSLFLPEPDHARRSTQ